MVGSICEWFLKDTICMIWHQQCGQILGLLPNAKQSNPRKEASKNELKASAGMMTVTSTTGGC
jgi:hypothetical protein